MAQERPARAAIFIDGNNWYHALRDAGVPALGRLSYSALSRKLTGSGVWIETRYYIGALKQDWNPTDYAAQRAFLAQIRRDDPKISSTSAAWNAGCIATPLPRPCSDTWMIRMPRYPWRCVTICVRSRRPTAR